MRRVFSCSCESILIFIWSLYLCHTALVDESMRVSVLILASTYLHPNLQTDKDVQLRTETEQDLFRLYCKTFITILFSPESNFRWVTTRRGRRCSDAVPSTSSDVFSPMPRSQFQKAGLIYLWKYFLRNGEMVYLFKTDASSWQFQKAGLFYNWKKVFSVIVNWRQFRHFLSLRNLRVALAL